MAQTILVIDANSAVQAITALALSQTGYTVEPLAEGALAAARISDLKPELVLCAQDMAGLDAVRLCQETKRLQPGTRFLLLAPAGFTARQSSDAKKQGFDAVLTKPFRSNALREVVEQLLAGTSAVEETALPLLIAVSDSLTERMIEKILQKRDVEYVTARVVGEAAPASGPFRGTIAEYRAAEDHWYYDETFGKLILLAEVDARTADERVTIIRRPITYERLTDALAANLSLQPEVRISEFTELEPGEQALLAARVSAAIYERLLTQPSFRTRDWGEAARSASQEVLRVTEQFEKEIS